MRSLFRHQSVILAAVFLTVGIIAILPAMLRSATYTPPPGAPPSGGVALLNTSATVQTKPGTLTLNEGLTVSSGSADPDLVVDSRDPLNPARICWNDDGSGDNCFTSWNDVVGLPSGQEFLELVSTGGEGLGWVDITGVDVGSQGTNPALSALDVTADEPAVGVNNQTYAIQASDAISGIPSYGVYAKASANSPVRSNVALYGIAKSTTSAWAGYFSGNVGIGSSDFSGTPYYYDLLVNSIGAANNGVGELCFNNVCKDAWPTIGDTYWIESANNSLQAIDPSWRLAVGGSNANAPFYYQDLPAQSSGELKVEGTGSTTGTLTLL